MSNFGTNTKHLSCGSGNSTNQARESVQIENVIPVLIEIGKLAEEIQTGNATVSKELREQQVSKL
jgi:hypothetical protein